MRINKGPVQLTTRTTRAGETRNFGTREDQDRETAETRHSPAPAPRRRRPARARAAGRSRSVGRRRAAGAGAGAGAGAATVTGAGAGAWSGEGVCVFFSGVGRTAPRARAPPLIKRGKTRRASREGPGRGRGRACVSRESGRGTGSGRGATHASAGGSSAQQRSRDAAAAAARPCGKGPGDFAFDGVRAAAGRARKAARSDCASGATSAGVTLGGSCSAVRARLGGGSAISQGTRTRNGQPCSASGDGRWSRRAGAARCSRGVLRRRRQGF